MAECPGGRINRRTRSQFRLGLPGLNQCKGFYPISLGGIMDAGQSPQAVIPSSSRDLISPSKGTRTLTVREYEQTISELKKENFELKLHLFYLDERMKKQLCKDKEDYAHDSETVQLVVQLNSEAESLRNELKYKDKLLAEANERADKIQADFKELQRKYADLESELSSLSELPSKDDILAIYDEKESLIKHTESLEKVLMEKEEEINEVSAKLEILANENSNLADKIKKRSLAIQGFVQKSCKEKAMLPGELRNIVISIVQAAKNKNKDDFAVARKTLNSALNQIMSKTVLPLNESEEKENIESPQAKCLKEEVLEQSSSLLCSKTEVPTEFGLFQASKMKDVYIQTDLVGSKLLSDSESLKLQEDADLSCNVDLLREDIRTLLLTIEDKNKELTDVKQSLAAVQDDLKKALSTTNIIEKESYLRERNELHEELRNSCSVNQELMRHLKELESFMEGLIQNKFDSSLESLSDLSKVLSNVSRRLSESLKLSNTLSDRLSVCEGSKLFEDCSYSEGKSFSHLGLSQLNVAGELSSHPGIQTAVECIPHVLKGDQGLRKEPDSSQLCWRCWQQLNPPFNQPEVVHPVQDYTVSKFMGYPSSDSDIWSEPDRDVSMQRIGISLQNSPVLSKSPRKLRQKDKRLICRLNSEQETSSSELQRPCKKRQGSASRRLFSKDCVRSQDSASEKFYFLLMEKYSKLGELLNELENVNNGKLSYEMRIKLKTIVEIIGEVLHKLEDAEEHAKNYPSAVCTKCVMLELYSELKSYYGETDFFIADSFTELEILQQFSNEICLLIDVCKGPFSFLTESCDRKNQSTQSDFSDDLSEKRPIKIMELEKMVSDLDLENRELSNNLNEVKRLLLKEKKALESVKSENIGLSGQVNCLKDELSTMKQKENELLLKNEKLTEELTHTNQSNLELTRVLKELDEKRQESTVMLDQLTSELQKNRSELVNMNNKCLEYEKQLSDQIRIKRESEDKLKTLESMTQIEKKKYLSQINDLNTEKNYHVQELKNTRERMLALEKENASVKDSLQAKNDELLTMQSAAKKLEMDKLSLNSSYKELQQELQNTKECLANLQKKCNSYEGEIFVQFQNQLDNLNVEKTQYFQELQKTQERVIALERENASAKDTLQAKTNELSSALEAVEKIQKDKVSLNSSYEELQRELKNTREDFVNLQKKCDLYEKEIVVQYKNQLDNLNAEKTHHLQELKTAEEKKLSLEKEKSDLRDDLLSKESELASSQERIRKLENDKEQLNSYCENLKLDLNEARENLAGLHSQLKKCYSSEDDACETLKKQIEDLSVENKNNLMELKSVQEKKLALEKENATINNTLQSQNSELLSLCERIKKLKSEKEVLSSDFAELQLKLKNTNEQLSSLQRKYNVDKNEVGVQCVKNEAEYSRQLKELEAKSLQEKQKLLDKISALVNEKEIILQKLSNEKDSEAGVYLQELKNIQEKRLSLEKENVIINDNLRSKSNEIASLKEKIKMLKNAKETYSSNCKELQQDLKNAKEHLADLQKKCINEEEVLLKFKENESKYCQQLKELEAESLSEKKKLLNKISDLTGEREDIMRKLEGKSEAEKNLYLEELKNIQERKLSLERENSAINDSLKSKNAELSSLQETISKLEYSKGTLNHHCEKLQVDLENARAHLSDLQKKCDRYDEASRKFKQKEEEYLQQLKELETKSMNEKEKLLRDIFQLTDARENISKSLNVEKERYERLKAERNELNEKYKESCKQISSLKLLNEELKSKQMNLSKSDENIQNKLPTSCSECSTLKNDLKFMRETLQNLESKCLKYEKQLVATAGLKDNLVECLLNIKIEFSAQRYKINEVVKAYGYENYVLWDETPFCDSVPVIDEENVQKICENISSETKKLSQSIDMLLGVLKSSHMKSVESKTSEAKINTKIAHFKEQVESQKVEVEQLKSQNDHLQIVIHDLQKSISDREKSIQFSTFEMQALRDKLHNSEQDIEKGNQLLKKKDDEITKLQERVFNLQTHINSNMTEMTKLLSKIPSKVDKSIECSLSSNNQLPSMTVSKASKICQTSEYEDTNQSNDESFTSVSSLDLSRNRCCEKYWKKYHSLKAKLSVCQKHIEILQKEKSDLRENLLQRLQNKTEPSENKDCHCPKVVELESKLEQRKAFISDLKGELLKTCNSLLDREKELNDLKQELANYASKSKHSGIDVSDRHSFGTLKSIDTDVKSKKNYKWKLMQRIFDIQRRFYEKRGIHLDYFNKFQDHVNNLHSMQQIQSLSKSESLPLLESSSLSQRCVGGDDKIRKLVDIELDIECLENLRIFLNRFFVPYVLETSDQENNPSQQNLSSDRFSLSDEVEHSRDSKYEITDILGISFPEVPIASNLDEILAEKALSFDAFFSAISQHVDCIQKFFGSVKRCHLSDSIDLSNKDSMYKTEVKSLLLKIFQEIELLHDRAEKLFKLNAHLKNFDYGTASPVLLSTSKPDVSDRESVMSEEIIAVSRIESPVSFDESCPVKLSHPERLSLKESTLKPETVGNKVIVTEPYGTIAFGSSCDSVCQRSHYSSPDLGIESDPNHDSSAPEQKEDSTAAKYQRFRLEEQNFGAIMKPPQKTAFTNSESTGRWSGHKFGDTLFAVGSLPHYELLKQEVKESLVAIKSILSRTGDGLHHIAKYTSPRKTLEYNTLKSIKDTCVHMEVCLKEANNLVGQFWTAPCPTEKDWKLLNDENQDLSDQLAHLKVMIQKQENEFKKALGNLEHAQELKVKMEKKISKKLVKTKKVIRQAEFKLLETRCQNFPPLPKYPSDQTGSANSEQQLC